MKPYGFAPKDFRHKFPREYHMRWIFCYLSYKKIVFFPFSQLAKYYNILLLKLLVLIIYFIDLIDVNKLSIY